MSTSSRWRQSLCSSWCTSSWRCSCRNRCARWSGADDNEAQKFQCRCRPPHQGCRQALTEPGAPAVDEDSYKLALDGLIENKQPWTLDQLYALPQETQITRLICVEGWSAIGKWTGAPLGDFLRRIGADLTAKYVHFACAEGYSVSVDMPTALHPQTQMTFK